MRQSAPTLAATIVCLFSATSALADGRAAVVIGTNRGLAHEPVLEFAESDARRLATTFVDVGAIPRGAVTVVTGRPLDRIKHALQQLPSLEEVWVFISGHADAHGIHVQGARWPWSDLRAQLEALPARRRVVFIDACNSGAVLTAKGVSLESQLSLAVRSNLRGLVVLVSSGANELSYESRRLQGSPFAHFLASGLRGAADQDGDGRVTLAEAYGYLAARTVAASLSGSAGPQHPEQAGWYQGQGEWVLARRVRGQGALRLTDKALGTCYALDAEQISVLAELRASDAAPVALPTGHYRIHCVSPFGARAASVELARATTLVESLSFEAVAGDQILARGPGVPPLLRLAVSGGGGVVGVGPVAVAAISAVIDHHAFAYELQLAGVSDARFMVKAALYGRVPWWQAGGTRLDVGLSVGHAGTLDSPGQLLFGSMIQLSIDIGTAGHWFLRQEILRSLPLGSDTQAELPMFTTTGLGWSLGQ